MENYIKWYENDNKIIITIDTNDTNDNTNIENDLVIFYDDYIDIKFESIINNSKQEFRKNLILYDLIDTKKSYTKMTNKLQIFLIKNVNISWPSLTKEKDDRIKIDWANWKYIDDEPDHMFNISNSNSNFNFNSNSNYNTAKTFLDSLEMSDSDSN